jgi:hypothetical protein
MVWQTDRQTAVVPIPSAGRMLQMSHGAGVPVVLCDNGQAFSRDGVRVLRGLWHHVFDGLQ